MKKEILDHIIHERMRAISALKAFQAMEKATGIYYENEINVLLDVINSLNKFEKEMNKK